jgi:hypothetical protein
MVHHAAGINAAEAAGVPIVYGTADLALLVLLLMLLLPAHGTNTQPASMLQRQLVCRLCTALLT